MKDPITIAFLGMAIRSTSAADRERAYSFNDGEIGTVDIVTDYADLIDTTYQSLVGNEGWSGVFAYDVVEPVGYYIMQKLAKNTIPTDIEVRDEVERLMRPQLSAA